MKRKLKFRVWDSNSRKMILQNGDFEVFHADPFLTLCIGAAMHGGSGDCDGAPDEAFEIMQSSGLKDKNGIEIYEGDVVSVYDKENLFEVCFGKIERKVVGYNDNSIYEVEINKLEFNGFYFRSLKDGKAYLSIVNNAFGEHDLNGTEVIGNIFENESLLK